ncbi:MAG: hypothetical protein ACOH5I_00695 [Oligoflexus sp.]
MQQVLKRMRRHVKIVGVMLACLLFLDTRPLAAQANNEKTLFRNGFYAAGVGDVWADHGQFWGQSYTALRFRAGFQLIRWSEFSLLVGYSKTGFYDAIRSSGEDVVKGLTIDYHGPTAELVFLPTYPINISLGGLFAANGQSYQNAQTLPADYLSSGGNPGEDNKIKSKLDVQEFHVALSYRFYRQLHLILGGGMRTIESNYQYSRCVVASGSSACAEVLWPTNSALSQKEDEPFFFIGIRGSQL